MHLDLTTDSNLDSPLVTLGQKGTLFQKPGAKKVHCYKNLGEKKKVQFQKLGAEKVHCFKSYGTNGSVWRMPTW